MYLLKFILLRLAFINAERWHLHSNTGIEYYVSDSTISFDNARTDCNAMRAVLVMIQTEDIQVFLKGVFTDASYSSGKTKLIEFWFYSVYLIISKKSNMVSEG